MTDLQLHNNSEPSALGCIVIAGGGSAGHVIPALPVADALISEGYRVHFIGTRSGLEQGYLGERDVIFHGISAGKLRRYLSLQNLTDVLRIAWAVVESIALLRRLAPSALFSKGGFVSLPPVFAAWLLRIPVLAHESDLTPGLANRLSLPFIKTLCTSFADTRFSGFTGRHVVTGTPVRESLLIGDGEAGRANLPVDKDVPVLLVTGGSLGAEGLNRVIRENLALLTKKYFVLHVCGAGKKSNLNHDGYLELEFVDQGWGDLLAAADMLISRAGANALFEWVALRKPNLLVPLPLEGSRGDQLANADYAKRQGWSEVIEERQLQSETLLNSLQALSDSADRYRAAMAQQDMGQATSRLVAEIERLSATRNSTN